MTPDAEAKARSLAEAVLRADARAPLELECLCPGCLGDLARPVLAALDGDCPECLAGIESGDGHNEGCSQRTAALDAPEELEPVAWRCTSCGESFICHTTSHAVHDPRCDGSCSRGLCPVECGPVEPVFPDPDTFRDRETLCGGELDTEPERDRERLARLLVAVREWADENLSTGDELALREFLARLEADRGK